MFWSCKKFAAMSMVESSQQGGADEEHTEDNPSTRRIGGGVGDSPGKQAVFMFVTEDGTVSPWNPAVNATNAVIEVDNSQKPSARQGAVYKGATIAEVDGKK